MSCREDEKSGTPKQTATIADLQQAAQIAADLKIDDDN